MNISLMVLAIVYFCISTDAHMWETELNDWLPVNSWVWIWIGHSTHEAELRWQEEGFTEQQRKEIQSNLTTEQQNKSEQLTSQVICSTFLFILYAASCYLAPF